MTSCALVGAAWFPIEIYECRHTENYITEGFIRYPDINILQGMVAILLTLDGDLDVAVNAVEMVSSSGLEWMTNVSM